ncbi:hypothetical protein BGZ76_010290 [Entomortierella beljakovae]|nr:hypothetical protein BGZ76_010290 [Entomortierella beljakovae]
MKLYASIGLAAIACAAAQASFDPMAAGSEQTNFAWLPEGNQKDIAAQVEEVSAAISELELRAQFLSAMEVNTSEFKAESISCDTVRKSILEAITVAKGAIDLASKLPVIGQLLLSTKSVIETLETVVSGGSIANEIAMIITINLAITAAKGIVTSAAVGPLALALNPTLTVLDTLQTLLTQNIGCFNSGLLQLEIQQSNCNQLADFYRQVISEAIMVNPALNLPADASEDLKRLAAGSLSVLDLMDKSCIATSNDALLASRPIFAADVLDQYRSELLRVATTEDIQTYAQAALGAAVGISNSLEACLRVAADPAGAINELNDELEAQAYYDEADEDDEDEDDEDDAEGVEVQSGKSEEIVKEQPAAA